MSALFSKQKFAYLGIDVGAHGIKVVELHKTKGRPQLWTYGLMNQPLDIHVGEKPQLEESQNPEEDKQKSEARPVSFEDDARIKEYGDLLKDLLRQSEVTTNICTASIPVSQVFHTLLTMPKVEKKELAGIVNAKIKKFLRVPVEQMQVMHQVISNEENKYMRVLVTAAPKSIITFYTAIFQHAGLELRELETEAYALERSLVGRDEATVIVVDIGSERTNFFVMSGSLPLIHRSIQAGGDRLSQIVKQMLDVPEDMVGQVKKDIARLDSVAYDSSIFDIFIQPILKEIKYSINVFTQQAGKEIKHPEKIILTGGSCVFPFIADRISKEFGMKTFVGDPWARVVYQDSLRPILDSIGPRMSVSIGLALRNIF